MIELSKHIEFLLLQHNCVIVPHLGGFIAQDVPAQYIAEENLFLPPHRTVGFNPQLTINDGLLVQSYMQTYSCNYPETIKLIEDAVYSLKGELQEKGEFYFNGIGKLGLNIDGQYIFTPNEAGVLSPDLYGLDSLALKKSKTISAIGVMEESSKKTQLRPEINSSRANIYTLRINKELVNYVAAAVVAIFFYFIWATPVTDKSTVKALQASMLFPQDIEHVTLDNNIKRKDSVGNSSCSSNPVEVLAPIKKNTIEIKEQDCFTIVLVSCIPQKNADLFLQELLKEGFSESYILQKRNLIRVVYGKYATEAKAYEDLRKLRKESEHFQESWILHNN